MGNLGQALLIPGKGGGFDPRLLGTPLLWLDATRITGLNDGDAVTTWADLSGNGKHATQGTAAKQPTYRIAGVNGRPTVQFDGGDALAVPAIDLTGTSAVTVFLVATAAAGSVQVFYEFSDLVTSVSDGFLVYRDAANAVIGQHRGNVGDSAFACTTALTTTAALAAFVFDKSLATNEVAGWRNGNTGGTRASNSNNTNAFGNRASYVGGRAAGSVFLTGHVCELAVYDRAHDDATQQRWWAYAQAKWGL